MLTIISSLQISIRHVMSMWVIWDLWGIDFLIIPKNNENATKVEDDTSRDPVLVTARKTISGLFTITKVNIFNAKYQCETFFLKTLPKKKQCTPMLVSFTRINLGEGRKCCWVSNLFAFIQLFEYKYYCNFKVIQYFEKVRWILVINSELDLIQLESQSSKRRA